MTLLTEVNHHSVRVLTEKTSEGKKLYVEGVVAIADKINKNNRVYPMAILEEEMSRYRTESIVGGHAVGELNHPVSQSTGVDASRIAIAIKSIKRVGSHFVAKSLVCDTPMGRILEGLIRSNVKLGYSTRGIGSTRSLGEGISEVNDDFRILAIDCVCAPSTDSYLTSLMEETQHEVRPGSVEHRLKNRVLRERIDYIRSHKRGSIYAAMFRGRMK
jgi:hypothetical protein